MKVEVNFLGGEYAGTGRSHRTQKAQDVRIRKARGIDLAFEAPVEVTVSGKLPTGGLDSVTLRVASIVSFLVMKGMALADRLKEKDSWDVYYCLKNYPGGVEEVIQTFKPHIGDRLVKEGLKNIAKHFESIEHVGPTHVTDFEEVTDMEERERIRRDAFERVSYLLTGLQIK
jgi:hypothetical protein